MNPAFRLKPHPVLLRSSRKCAPTFDVSNVNAHAEKEPVVIVGTTGKGPRFRTPLELAFLALPNVALRHWAAKVFSRFILVKVNEIGAPSRIDVVGEVVMKTIGGIAVDSGKIRVNLRASWINALAKGIHVEVVGAREADAKLGVTQGSEVASLLCTDVAYIGYGEAHPVVTVGSPIVVGGKVVVHEAECGGELGATIDAQACRVDADGGHVATHCTHGVAHAHGFGSALVVGLREKACIVGALSKCGDDEKECQNCGDYSLHF